MRSTEDILILKDQDLIKSSLTSPYNKDVFDLKNLESLLADLSSSGEEELFIGRINKALEQLNKFQHTYPKDNFDSQYTWFEAIAFALVSGWPPLEIETLSPYTKDYQAPIKDISDLKKEDQSGAVLWHFFRDLKEIFSNVHMVTMVDDFNGSINGKENFLQELIEALTKLEAIKASDRPGSDYIVLLESDMAKKADLFITKLKESGKGRVILDQDQLRFVPNEKLIKSLNIKSKNRRKELKRQGVLLKKGDLPSCPLMDCVGYADEVNKMIIHFNILPASFKQQQDHTYTLLRALDLINQELYHNAYFDDQASSEEVLAWIADSFIKALEAIKEKINQTDNWAHFDPREYATRNYGKKILPEDEAIVSSSISFLNKTLKEKSLKNVIDIGAGPNLYPAMLWGPFLQKDSRLFLREYVQANRDFLEEEIKNPEPNWAKFRDLMVTKNPIYKSVFEDISGARVEYGSIIDLKENQFDGASAFFVSESITYSRIRAQIMINRLIDSLKPGGVFLFAHMLGSAGYYAGEDTNFPATPLTKEDINRIYLNRDLDFQLVFPNHPDQDKVRDGYHGMVLVFGQKY